MNSSRSFLVALALSASAVTLSCGDDAPDPIECGPDTWLVDDVCRAWSACDLGTFVQTPGTATSDVVCGVCPEGSYASTTNADSCTAWGVCAPGTFVVVAGTVSSDAVCSGCPSGTFAADNDADACVSWTVCERGEFVATPGTSVADQACAPCGDGTTSDGENRAQCVPVGTCPAGTVQTAPGTSEGPPTCVPCELGEHCRGGVAPAVACTEGTWDHDSDPATACVSATDCLAGEYVTHDASATNDRGCAPCAAGTFNDRANQATCAPHVVCPEGAQRIAAGTAATDATCAPCTTAGTYCAGGDAEAVACTEGTWDHDSDPATACVNVSDCLAGMYVTSDATTTADRGCAPCATGTYNDGVNPYTCEPHTVCSAGSHRVAEGTAAADSECAPCITAGTYCAGGDVVAVPCADGAWDHDGDTATVCVAVSACSAGGYEVAEPTATSDRVCAPCERETFSEVDGATACTPWNVCASGSYVTVAPTATSDRACADCDDGFFSAVENAAACEAWTVCAAGAFEMASPSASADRVCAACPAESFSDTENQTDCVGWSSCTAGTYELEAPTTSADRVCADCESGTFTDGENATECVSHSVCLPGTYAVEGDTTVDTDCQPCADGTWDDDLDPMTACVPWSCAPDSQLSPGTPTTDAVCLRGWTVMLSPVGPYSSRVGDVATGPDGKLYVAASYHVPVSEGSTERAYKAFVSILERDGTLVRHVEVGDGTQFSQVLDVTVDADGNIYVCGGLLTGSLAASETGFVMKMDADGNHLWTVQPGRTRLISVIAVTDEVVFFNFSGRLMRVDPVTGTVLSESLLPEISPSDIVLVPGVGVVLTGYAWGDMPGHTSVGNWDVGVAAYDFAGDELWTQRYGTTELDVGRSITSTADGIFVAANVAGSLAGQTNAGSRDVVVTRLSHTGEVQWHQQFGTDAHDEPAAVLEVDGDVLVFGETAGLFPGGTDTGGQDEFWASLSTDGTGLSVEQTTAGGAECATRHLSNGVVSVSIHGGVKVVRRMR